MNRICKCDEVVNLQGDNIGRRIIYENFCPKCNRFLVVEIDARTGAILKDVNWD